MAVLVDLLSLDSEGENLAHQNFLRRLNEAFR